MGDKRKSFSFIWKIKNFSFGFNSLLTTVQLVESPIFVVHAMCRSSWSLRLYSKSFVYADSIVCSLMRQFDIGQDELGLDYELSFLGYDESVIHSEVFLNKTFQRLFVDYDTALTAKRVEVFMHKKHLFLPDDTLTIRCRMWKSKGSFSESLKCSVLTRMGIECISFDGNIQKFSSLEPNSKTKVCVETPEKQFKCPAINLCVSDNGKLGLEILHVDYKLYSMYKFKAFILDVYGNKVKSCDEKICNIHPFSVPLFFSKTYLTENKEPYLARDELSLQFELIFCICYKSNQSEYKLEIIDSMVYEYDCQGNQTVTTEKTNMNLSEEQHTETLTTLKDDFIALCREGILSDTKLKTATETFPAHKAVLSARSPVFRSMFATDMREKTNSCVDIDDLNSDTVRQMLLFMYSDTLDDLNYESAKSLYFASDKYNILSLKRRCSQFLKQNMLHSNCCDVLLLADRHQDKDLKSCVQDCIAENDEAVFSSDEWKNLMESQPRLTTEVLLAVYMKNRRT